MMLPNRSVACGTVERSGGEDLLGAALAGSDPYLTLCSESRRKSNKEVLLERKKETKVASADLGQGRSPSFLVLWFMSTCWGE